MKCEFKEPVIGSKCIHCGYALRRDYAEPPIRECSIPGLGDRIESALTAVGITQESWGAFKEKFGLPPGCNCDETKELINDAEQWAKEAAANLGEKAWSAISTMWTPVSRLRKKPTQSGNSPAE